MLVYTFLFAQKKISLLQTWTYFKTPALKQGLRKQWWSSDFCLACLQPICFSLQKLPRLFWPSVAALQLLGGFIFFLLLSDKSSCGVSVLKWQANMGPLLHLHGAWTELVQETALQLAALRHHSFARGRNWGNVLPVISLYIAERTRTEKQESESGGFLDCGVFFRLGSPIAFALRGPPATRRVLSSGACVCKMSNTDALQE